MRLSILIAASLFALCGCVNKPDPPSEAPSGVTAANGDGVILMTWDMLPALTYWIFYAQGSSVSPGQLGSIAIKNAVSPRAVTGLLNDTDYALVMNASNQGSAAGPNSQVVMGRPRLAGNFWTQGSVQGTHNLNALAFNGTGRYVTVGDGTTIFAGDFNYGHTNPVGVTQWFDRTTNPAITWFPGDGTSTTVPPIPADYKAVIFNGSFVALGATGEVALSADGVNWAPQHAVLAAGGVSGLTGLAFGNIQGNGTYIAVGSGGQIYTTNALTQDWTLDTSGITTSDLTSITLLNQGFFVTGSNGTLLHNPGDGTGWSPVSTGVTTTLRATAFMQNAPLLSPPSIQSIRYVAVGDSGTILTSTDATVATAWTVAPPSAFTPAPPVQNLLAVTVGGATGTRFLAIGQGGVAVFGDSVINDATGVPQPVNPIQWSVASQPATGDFSSVHFFTGQYLTVGAAGANAVSH
ncbi:MAG TPA: hypothetical protein VKB63_09395 [Gemmatimonadales bacterium]|nr:hypothetical protein [Gemmatimonadales bacterium]